MGLYFLYIHYYGEKNMRFSNKLFLTSLLLSTSLYSANSVAQILPDINIDLNTPIIYPVDYVGLTVATPINTVNLNVNAGTFNGSVYGNKIGIGTNSNLSFNNGTVNGNVVGLERSLLEPGKILTNNTINIAGGTIKGNVLATSDAPGYVGTDRRTSNTINFSGGTINGNIEGGGGAANNVINITGGVLHHAETTSGTIYAGSSAPSANNKSTNATVSLKDMNNANSFLSTFKEGSNGTAGMIIGSNISGKSNLEFDGVNGNYQGGFKDFDSIHFSQKSATNAATNVKLTGNTYKADIWNVDGILDTNGKTLSAYKNSVSGLALNVGATGSLSNQFISDVKVVANNSGSIKGIKSVGKEIDLINNGLATGAYEGDIVKITNTATGTISGNTSISSSNTVTAGLLDNSGLVTGNLSVSGNVSINNKNSGNIKDSNITNNQPVLNINNNATMSGNNTITNKTDLYTTNINNGTGGVVTGGLTVKDGTLNLNNNQGTITNLNMTSDSAVFNINNNHIMNGNNSLNSLNGGTLKLTNGATGDLSGILNVNSGLSALGAFSNAGTIHDLTLNNAINNLAMANTGTINGTNVINNATNNTGFIINNNLNGKISGSINNINGNFDINNAAGGNIKDLSLLVSGNGVISRIENSGLINGNNVINVSNNGRVLIGNNSGGTITGAINNINGSDIYNNDGATIHDLVFTNSQENTGIKNLGTVSNLTLNNTDSSKYMTLFNYGENGQGEGEVTGNLKVNDGTLYLASSGLIENLNVVADNNSRVNIYNAMMAPSPATGEIKGTNTFEGKNGALIYINNMADGDITGIFNTVNGTTITNQGQIENLTTNNSQNSLNVNNVVGGQLNGTNIFNNSDDTKEVNIRNQSTDILNGGLVVKNGTLNLNNKEGSTINGYDMVADSAILNINNEAMISGTNTIENKNGGEADLNNYAGGTVTGSLALKGGSLDLANLGGANLKDLTLKADAGTINVANTGAISGSNVIENANNGVINLANNQGGNLTGALDVKSGLGTFTNAGRIDTLALTNEQANLTLDNSGLMMGDNSFINTISTNTITINNAEEAGITGTLSSTGGNFNLNNAANALISDLNYTNISSNAAITNAGTINNSSIKNMLATQMDLNNTGLISGVGDWRNVDLNNQTGGVVQSATITSIDNGVVNIANSGTFNGNNILNSTGNGTFTFNNAVDGKINGGLTVNGGLNALANAGVIENLILTSNVADFKVNNTGTVSGNNALVSATETVTLNNTGAGTVGGNLVLNAPIVNLNQESTGAFNVALGSQNANTVLNIKNDTDFTASLAGGLKDINLVNNNTVNVDAHLTLANLGNISGSIKIDNDGYTKIDNQGTISVGVGSGGVISDNTSPAVPSSSCLVNTVEINNSGRIDNDISVMNNIFKLNNTGTGYIDSNHIDTRDLRLTNAGTFDSDVSYLFSVQDHMNVVNSGSIYGWDMAFKLTGDKVTGTIDNTGTIYSQGTTIGYGPDPLVPCPDCYLDGDKLTINNSGRIVAVDVPSLTIPGLGSYAVDGKNINLVNQTGGLIGGSIHVNDYTQESGSTWVTFMNKDLTQMSTIFAENDISIASDSILNIHTNNDVKAFTNGQKFLLVDAAGMTAGEIDAQIENFKIVTDSPFANYEMLGENDQGYIVFNHVDPTNFETSTDMATASHNATILGSQRMYELFVNRDINQVQGLASGDSYNTTNKLNFMPIGGVAHQGDKGGHAGYDTNYYGGLGYWEHDFNNNLKGGLGFAYMNNSTDFKDADGSDGSIDSYRPFAYINYEQGAWRFDLAGGVAKHKVDNKRKYSFNNTQYLSNGKYDADEISGHLNIGYKMMLENDFVIQPMVGAYAAKLKTDSFKETGSGPMNMHVASEDYNSFKSMLGVKFSKEYELDNGSSITPEFHMRWYHELGDTNGGVTAYFLAQEQMFSTSGIEMPKDVGDVAFRLTTKTGTNLDLFTEAYYQFGSKFYNAGGTVGLQYNF